MGLATHLLRLGIGRSAGKNALEESLPPHQRRWLPQRLMRQATRWSVPQISDALRGLRRVDRILKSSSLPEERVLEEWLLGLMLAPGEKSA